MPVAEQTSTKPYTFICGADDFLVNQQGEKLFNQYTESLSDPMSQEVIDGMANNVGEVESIVGRFLSAFQTLSMFDDRKVVWLKGMSFMGDNQTARAEFTKRILESLIESLNDIEPEAVSVIITASPIDRRTRAFKAIKKACAFTFIEGAASGSSLESLIKSECQALGVKISSGAATLLAEKANGNTRLLVQEITKLATYLGAGDCAISETLVNDLVPQFGEGDFFETTEAFYAQDIDWTLAALRRHFFNKKDACPIISALQNRNRLLLQLRTMIDAQSIRMSYKGVDKDSFQHAAATYGLPFADTKNKSAFNIFSQHPWYLGKLADVAKKLSLRKLVDFQNAFIQAFEKILKQPTEQEDILRSMVIRCLT